VPPSAARQGLIALVPGITVGVLFAVFVIPGLGPLAGYDAAVVVYVTLLWLKIWPLDADATSQLAAREDPTRPLADLVLLTAAVVSLGAVVIAMVQSHSSSGTTKAIEVGMAAGSIVVSWALVHTIFMLKYARLYYGAGGEGGVDFKHKVRPPYSDFGYLSLTIGMTFQVSDTDLQSADFRRLALRHALLSYLFGAVILAATINLVASLAG
jgi:uncharacterized membrane protein